jgi:hypothetical protein
MTKKDEIPEDLKRTLDEAEWCWLKPHLARDSLIIVEKVEKVEKGAKKGLELLEVGNQIAANNSQQVNEWIQQAVIRKPTPEEIQAWDLAPTTRFMIVIVQPYILIQKS